jgi:hypothetical protein
VNAFWSVTLYDTSGFLVDNPIDRYLINDRTDLHYNEDGSLDLYIQSTEPTDPQQAQNWLPSPPGAAFRLLWRLYATQPDQIAGVLNGTGWIPWRSCRCPRELGQAPPALTTRQRVCAGGPNPKKTNRPSRIEERGVAFRGASAFGPMPAPPLRRTERFWRPSSSGSGVSSSHWPRSRSRARGRKAQPTPCRVSQSRPRSTCR